MRHTKERGQLLGKLPCGREKSNCERNRFPSTAEQVEVDGGGAVRCAKKSTYAHAEAVSFRNGGFTRCNFRKTHEAATIELCTMIAGKQTDERAHGYILDPRVRIDKNRIHAEGRRLPIDKVNSRL